MHESVEYVHTNEGKMPVNVYVPTLEETYPGIIVFMDVFGFREEFRQMCRRYATAGYAVFFPGLYHRHGNPSFPPANQIGDAVSDKAISLNAATTMELTVADTTSLIEQVDQLTDVNVPVFGTVGYCMGGRHAVACAAKNPQQVRAAASIHGGQLINSGPYSMEKLIDQVNGEIYFGFAKNDRTCSPEDQGLITSSLARSTTPGRVEVFEACHGWTFPDRHCFDEKAADRTWENMFHLFRTRLWGDQRV